MRWRGHRVPEAAPGPWSALISVQVLICSYKQLRFLPLSLFLTTKITTCASRFVTLLDFIAGGSFF